MPRPQIVIRLLLVGATLVTCGLLLPSGARAQSAASGSIAGVVKDTTGAVLPGVTVEAASPALIEKIRTVVTDDQGQYKIVDLRPGTYMVTFSLAGFNTVKREGIELPTGFTATANAELRVGAIEETVTVSGATPVVDTHSVRQQNVLSREHLDAVPSGRTLPAYAALTLGTTGVLSASDVGGAKGESVTHFGVHGSDGWDLKMKVDGMSYNNLSGQGGGVMRLYKINHAAIQEVVLEVSGMSAETETGGVQLNAVPKEGGNRFSIYANANGTGGGLQTTNLTSDLRARGVTATTKVKNIYDVGIGAGGPIKKDKLWFYAAYRSWGALEYQPGAFYNKTPHTLFYTADESRPAYIETRNTDASLRLTWQAGQKHKINLSHSQQDSCHCLLNISSTLAPEAVAILRYAPVYLTQATWSHAASNRLLFEAGATYGANYQQLSPQPETSLEDFSVLELSTGLRYGARVGAGQGRVTNYEYAGLPNYSNQANQRLSVSYVTGSHALKTGLYVQEGWAVNNTTINPVSYTLLNRQPVSLTEWAAPFQDEARVMPNLGIYVQDHWTMRRLTLNVGLRFDSLNAYDPEFHYEGGPFVPAYDFPSVRDVPNWKDLSPRLGGAYDLFGNGKTAVKASLGRYVAGMGVGIASLSHPSQAIVTSANRTWNDRTYPGGDNRNGNYVPDCDLQNLAANGECGALDNNRFGQVVVNTRYADDVLKGWGTRPYSWQASASIQHELRPRTALTVGYFRTWYGNIQATDNLAVGPADYDPFCVTSPVDARLPGGGGTPVCGLYNVTSAKFGQVDNLVTQASKFGKRTQVYNGVDVAINARFGQGGLLNGGLNLGRTMVDNCSVVDFPLQFCRTGTPYQPQVKFSGVYPVPVWGLQASAMVQSLPGVPVAANFTASNAAIAPSLGRNLSACSNATGPCNAQVTVMLMDPNTKFEKRLNQVDVRLTKIVRLGRARVQGMFDIYNVFNASTVLGVNPQYGAAWLRPTAILGARLFKFGAELDF